MDNLTGKRRGFKSHYKIAYDADWELKNTGFNYEEELMKKTLSSYMFGNERLSTFILEHLNPIMVFFINKVKFLRIYYNFAVPKDYEKIN